VVTVTQFTAQRTVTAKSGAIVPTTINQQTDMNFLTVALSVYYRINERRVAWDTACKVCDAMRDSSAVVVMYADAKGEIAARVLWPTSITLSKDCNITCHAYCTLRREWRSFRLDRMIACHELTTPDDIEADNEPHQDFEDSPAAWGTGYR